MPGWWHALGEGNPHADTSLDGFCDTKGSRLRGSALVRQAGARQAADADFGMSERCEHMIRRTLPYAADVGAVGVASLGLAVLAWALGIPRIETFLLILVLLVGAIAWRLGR